MNLMLHPKSQRIRELNDLFRRTFIGGAVMLTPGIQALGIEAQTAVVSLVREFSAFDDGNDPYAEHDFGSVEHGGVTIFFKIDYYDRSMEAGSDDPADPRRTTRVLTIMTAEEY